MKKFSDLSGQVFGKLTVEACAGRQNGKTTWLCRCVCGNRTTVRRTNLQRGCTKSCPKCAGSLTRDNPRAKMWQSLLGPELTEQLVNSVYAEIGR